MSYGHPEAYLLDHCYIWSTLPEALANLQPDRNPHQSPISCLQALTAEIRTLLVQSGLFFA